MSSSTNNSVEILDYTIVEYAVLKTHNGASNK